MKDRIKAGRLLCRTALTGILSLGWMFGALAAQQGPYDPEVSLKGGGDLVISMTEPQEPLTDDQTGYTVLGMDLSVTGSDGKKEQTIRLMFDESRTVSGYDSSHTRIRTEKVIPAAWLKKALGEDLWKQYQEHAGDFILDGVLAETVNGVRSAALSPGESYRAVTTPNQEYPRTPLILSLDFDQDMAFGEGEESRFLKLSDWEDREEILSWYNLPVRAARVSGEPLAPSSHQGSGNVYASKAEQYQTFSREEPYLKTYNDSRETAEDGSSTEAYTDEGSLGMMIPAGGNYINGVTADSSCGTISVGLRGAVHTWKFSYNYEYWAIAYGEDGEPYLLKKTGTVEIPVDRKAYYLYLWNLDLYDLESVESKNSAASGGRTQYASDQEHLVNQEVAAGTQSPVTKEELAEYLSAVYGGGETSTDRPVYEARIATREDGKISVSGIDPAVIQSYVPDDAAHVAWADFELEQPLGEIGLAGAVSADAEETAACRAKYLASRKAEELVGNGADQPSQTKSGEQESFAVVTNDYLRTGYDGAIVLDGETLSVTYEDSDDWKDDYGKNELPEYLKKSFSMPDGFGRETYETTPAFGRSLLMAEEDTEKGDYYTGVEAVYRPVLVHVSESGTEADSEEESASKEKQVLEEDLESKTIEKPKGSKESAALPAIKEGYEANEPFTVYPQTDGVRILSLKRSEEDPEELSFRNTVSEVQLTEEEYNDARIMNLIQLKLDETYYLSFSDEEEETDAEITAYIHFPFDVVLYEDGEPVYYRCSGQVPSAGSSSSSLEKKDVSGGQYWIRLSDLQKSGLSFYLPPWAKEGMYMNQFNGKQIQYREDRILEDPETGEEVTETSTDSIDCQVSGWLYDFEILGVRDTIGISDPADTIGSWRSLLLNRTELKPGTKNRLGYQDKEQGSYVREDKDGTVTNQWSEADTLALANGKSRRFSDMGTLQKGSMFSFSIKTLSNQWNDEDYLEITPHLRYISRDGAEYEEDEFSIYYRDDTGKTRNVLLLAGAEQDHDYSLPVSLSSGGLDGAVSMEDLIFLAKEPSIHELLGGGSYQVELMNDGTDGRDPDYAAGSRFQKTYAGGTFRKFLLGTESRTYSGKEELLSCNVTLNRDSCLDLDDLLPIPDDNDPSYRYDEEWEKKQREYLLRVSMQEWHGVYSVPEELYVSLHTNEELEAYAKTHGGISEDCELFEKSGYLVINFEITSCQNRSMHLSYGGNGDTLNMWSSQNQDRTIEVNGRTINGRYGDVAVVDLSRTVSDSYRTSLTN